jgi:OFA family oxalate/formate antiporter-like MFS transporter
MAPADSPRVEPSATRRWRQLAACIVAMMAVANLQYAWTLFTIPLTQSLHATLSAVQLAFTFFILTETWLVPFEGWLVDRVGARAVVSAAALLVGISWIGAGLVDSLRGLYLFYALGGVGAGAVYGACVGTALKWFPDRRGLAAGLTAGAYGIGTALTVLPIQWMIRTVGYRSAFLTWGIVQGVCVMAMAQLLTAPSASWRPRGWQPAAPAARGQSLRSYRPLEMVRTRPFWAMYLMMALVAFGGLMVTAQLKPIAHTYGLDRGVLVLGMSALSVALILDRILNGLTRPFWGWVSDRIGRYDTMAIAFCAEAAAIIALLNLVHRPLWFVVLTGLAFFAWGEIFSLFPAAIGDVFGPAHATTNYGVQYTAKGMAAIFAGWGAARLVELTGSWIPVFWVAVACDLTAAGLAMLWLKPVALRECARVRADATPAAAPAVSA